MLALIITLNELDLWTISYMGYNNDGVEARMRNHSASIFIYLFTTVSINTVVYMPVLLILLPSARSSLYFLLLFYNE